MAATVSFRTSAVSTADLTTYTFSSQDIGAAASDRKIAIAIIRSGANTTIASVTVAGSSASLVKAQAGSASLYGVEIWQIENAALPVGNETAADIVVTYGAGVGRSGIGIWAIYGADAAASDTDGSTASPPSVAIDCPADGVIVAVTQSPGSFGAITHTWTGLTENYDATVEGTPYEMYHSGASGAFSSTQTGLTVTATPSASVDSRSMAVASWGPAAGAPSGQPFAKRAGGIPFMRLNKGVW